MTSTATSTGLRLVLRSRRQGTISTGAPDVLAVRAPWPVRTITSSARALDIHVVGGIPIGTRGETGQGRVLRRSMQSFGGMEGRRVYATTPKKSPLDSPRILNPSEPGWGVPSLTSPTALTVANSRHASSSSTYPQHPSPDPSSSSSSSPDPSEQEPTTLSARLKALFTKYGKHAIGMYLLLSSVDLSIAYLLVHLVGADKIEHVKDVVVGVWGEYMPHLGGAGDAAEATKGGVQPSTIDTTVQKAIGNAETTSDEIITTATEGKKKPSSMSGTTLFWAEFALAYGIHKTLFLPVRVGLTAAWTPKVVAWLTRRGWVGKGGVSRAALHGKEKGLEKVKNAQEKVKVAQEKAQEKVKETQEKLKELRRKG